MLLSFSGSTVFVFGRLYRPGLATNPPNDRSLSLSLVSSDGQIVKGPLANMLEVTPTGQFLAEITNIPSEEFYLELSEKPQSGANDASECCQQQ